jgi:hypothetical protein
LESNFGRAGPDRTLVRDLRRVFYDVPIEVVANMVFNIGVIIRENGHIACG